MSEVGLCSDLARITPSCPAWLLARGTPGQEGLWRHALPNPESVSGCFDLPCTLKQRQLLSSGSRSLRKSACRTALALVGVLVDVLGLGGGGVCSLSGGEYGRFPDPGALGVTSGHAGTAPASLARTPCFWKGVSQHRGLLGQGRAGQAGQAGTRKV